MKNLIGIVFFFATSIAAVAQTPQVSTAPLESRYELIQSTIGAKGTYRLDKYTGDVHQMVVNKNEDKAWKAIGRLPHSLDVKREAKVNYQLFTSGLAMRFTYLININTGATWQLVEDQDKDLVWSPIL